MRGSSSSGGSPCGACKFLRRKCASECIFAPYFDSEEGGTSRFAAVHKIFGASNTTKLLMMIPASRRFDAVFTLSYEALARLRDPVHGCVAHIFALQHQVMNLQAELAYVKTQLSTLQRLLPTNPRINSPSEATSSLFNAPLIPNKSNVSSSSSHIHCMTQQQQQQPKEDNEVSNEFSKESMDLSTLLGPAEDEGDLNILTREFVSKYLTRGQ